MDQRRFKIEDASSYADVVSEYDTFVRRFSPPLVSRLIALAGLRAGERVLDVGTGSGIVALSAARALDGGGAVVGIDLSLEMLRQAWSHARGESVETRTTFVRMDGESLGFGDASFDKIVSLFALLHLPNPAAGIAEMLRVLKPGGRVVIAVGSGAPLTSPSTWPHYLQRVRDRFQVLAGRRLEAPRFLDELVSRHCPPREVSEESPLASAGLNRTKSVPDLVREGGFEDVTTHWEGHVGYLESAQEFWDMQRTYSSFARKRLEHREGREAVRSEFFSRVERVTGRGGKLAYPYGAVFVTGTRPRASA
jgi:ubiquinone/menaquinone biosynthesis C-methylase UbiE